eukprot:3516776-Rhodomonas_salina.2
MFGTELAYAAIGLRACYAMSGTELAYAPTRRLPMLLRICSYAMGGTEIFSYWFARCGTERYAVLVAMCLTDACRRCCYAMRGTEL